MKTVRHMMAELPKKRQARIDARAKTLIAEEMSLQNLRKAHRKTQKAMAAQLGIGQDSVSRLEQRSDMLLSTLREYVAAMGGKIRLMAEFKGAAPIELTGLGALDEIKTSRRRRLEPRRRIARSKAA